MGVFDVQDQGEETLRNGAEDEFFHLTWIARYESLTEQPGTRHSGRAVFFYITRHSSVKSAGRRILLSGFIAITFLLSQLAPALAAEKFVYIDDGIYIADADGQNQVQVTTDNDDMYPALSPDLSTVAFQKRNIGNTSDLYLVDSDGQNQRLLFNDTEGSSSSDVAFSPNTPKIVFERTASIMHWPDIYSIGLDGQNLTQLTFGLYGEYDPALSADGNFIVYSDANASGYNQLVTMRIDGSDMREITPAHGEEDEYYDIEPAFSPDGEEIVFNRSVDAFEGDIWKIGSDGTGLTRLTSLYEEGVRYVTTPTWSADGGTILFNVWDPNGSIWAMDTDGSNKRLVIEDGYFPNFRQATSGSNIDYEELLEFYSPFIKYDSQENYYYDSAAEATDNPGKCRSWKNRPNLLMRSRWEILAAAYPYCGAPELSLGFLGFGPNYPSGAEVRSDDYIDYRNRYKRDAQRMHADPFYANKIYGRVVEDQNDGATWLQYWLYAYYNDFNVRGIGVHEGDWEMVQVQLEADGMPVRATYAQHNEGETCDWDLVEKTVEGGPVIYAARGSHASYFKPGKYNTGVPTVKDRANGEGDWISPTMETVSVPPNWILWPGKWGGSGSSPSGPSDQQSKWYTPSEFADRFACRLEERGAKSGRSPSVVPPQPEISAQIRDDRVEVHYSFKDMPKSVKRRPKYILLTVDSAGSRYPPRSYPSRVKAPTGDRSIPLTPGGGPYRVKASSFTEEMYSSDVVVGKALR